MSTNKAYTVAMSTCNALLNNGCTYDSTGRFFVCGHRGVMISDVVDAACRRWRPKTRAAVLALILDYVDDTVQDTSTMSEDDEITATSHTVRRFTHPVHGPA